jgi:hypothetical protein
MGNPDNLETQSFRSYIRMLYDQFLCCFCHNAEIWLSLINYVLLQTDKRLAVAEARDIYHQAIECNPSVSLLRTGLAELEELGVREVTGLGGETMEFSTGDFNAAENVLREAFACDPGGFTFSVFQRFVRRHRGKLAARKLFSATLVMRNEDPKLGFEVRVFCFFSLCPFYVCLQLLMVHARLEEEVNCDLATALRVFDIIREKYPNCMKNMIFIRSVFKVLTALGQLKQIQWLYQTARSYVEADTEGDRNIKPSTQHVRNNAPIKTALGVSAYESAKFEMELVDAYLQAETVLTVSGIEYLNSIREHRNVKRAAFEDLDRMRYGGAGSSSLKIDGKVSAVGVFDSAADLLERYAYNETVVVSLSEKDRDLRDRSGREADERSRCNVLIDGQLRRDNEILNMSAEFHLSLAGLPIILRDLLSKLPLHNGNSPDIDCFVRHIKSITLPPRPSVEDTPDNFVNMEERYDEDRETGGSWLVDCNAEADEVDDELISHSTLGKGGLGRATSGDTPEEDLFRKRQRAKVA